MKIEPITNNMTFSSRINYNQTMQKGFEMAKESANLGLKKDVDFAKTFADNIRTILNDGKGDTVEISTKSTMYREGYYCSEGVKAIASHLETQKNKGLESLKLQLEGAMDRVELLKEMYAQAVQEELLALEKKVQNF